MVEVIDELYEYEYGYRGFTIRFDDDNISSAYNSYGHKVLSAESEKDLEDAIDRLLVEPEDNRQGMRFPAKSVTSLHKCRISGFKGIAHVLHHSKNLYATMNSIGTLGDTTAVYRTVDDAVESLVRRTSSGYGVYKIDFDGKGNYSIGKREV